MFWVEEENPDIFTVPDDIIDVAFDIECKTLPVDHVQSLFDAVSAVLPWLADEARAGLHAIHGAETGNGWITSMKPLWWPIAGTTPISGPDWMYSRMNRT